MRDKHGLIGVHGSEFLQAVDLECNGRRAFVVNDSYVECSIGNEKRLRMRDRYKEYSNEDES